MAVYSALPRRPFRAPMVERLYCYVDGNVPRELLSNVSNQMEQVQSVARSFDQYSKEERDSFPRLWRPKDDLLVYRDPADEAE